MVVEKQTKKIFGCEKHPVNLVKRILHALWLVLGVIALSALFAKEEARGTLQNHFQLVLYLGFLAVVTIVSGTSINLWFRNSIQKKIEQNDDPTAFKFLRSVAVFSIYFIGILFGLMTFPSLRGVAQTALGGAGILALVAGISSQEALSNLVGGLFIISFKPSKLEML